MARQDTDNPTPVQVAKTVVEFVATAFSVIAAIHFFQGRREQHFGTYNIYDHGARPEGGRIGQRPPHPHVRNRHPMSN